ncbi:hypothetical protein RN629_02750 [Sphingomonadaceae bacterium jetA1]|jgi:hypothetical protein|uniref:hypothetical protein n=1 Tax=Facivitalis istanbulensis TaxID=3075838 RepID=UPI003471E307
MLPLSLLILLLGAPRADVVRRMTLPHLTTACIRDSCRGTARPSPDRLLPDHALPIDSKARAFADDGTYCAVVGDKYCLSTPHTLFRASIGR